MQRTILRAVLIALTGAVTGVLVNAVSLRAGGGLPWIRPPKLAVTAQEAISLAEAGALWSRGAATFLDARRPDDYTAGHIAGAFNLPVEEFEQRYPDLAPLLTSDGLIVVYCDGAECDLSHDLAVKLRALGYRQVRVLVNGWTLWRQAGYSTHVGAEP